MNLRQLRYFTQAIECGSLSKASRQLFIAQPALSQQIAKLESTVGKPLLHRSSQGVTPTESGRALYHHARLMLRQLDQALSIARQESNIQGMVSLGLPSTTQNAIGLPLIKRIRRLYPQIILNVVEGMSGHLAQMVRLRQLDLAVLFTNDAISDLEPTPLIEEELFIIAPANCQWIPPGRTSLTLEEAAKLPMILPTASHGLRRRVAATFEQHNVPLNIVAEIDSLSLLMNCVRDGIGVTIKPMAAILAQHERSQNWRTLSISNAIIDRRNYIYSLASENFSPSILVISDQLKSVTEELVSSGQWPGVTFLKDNELLPAQNNV